MSFQVTYSINNVIAFGGVFNQSPNFVVNK